VTLPSHDALAMLELDSVARGYRTLDAMVKRSPVQVLEANLVEPGRFLILFAGGVAEVEEAWSEGLEVGGECLQDKMMLPYAHTAILPGLAGALDVDDPDTVGVVESRTVASVLLACDRALKDAEVALAGLRITPSLGGRGYYVVHGIQHDVEAALAASREVLEGRGALHKLEIIPRPHPDFLAYLLRPAPFRIG
jgi:microcompartment protein CcmL/EutN